MSTVRAAVIFVVALTLRLAAVQALGDLPISRVPQLDSAAYLSWARALMENVWFWPSYPEHAPGYPMFLAAVLSIVDSLTAVRIVQAILGSIACVMTARIAARTMTPAAFLPAGLLHAAYAPLLYLDTAILAESLFVFLLVWSLDIVTGANHNRRRWLFAGLVLGAAIVVRPTAALLLVAFAIVIWRLQTKAAPRLTAALVAGTLVIVAPIVIQNWRVTGVPMVQAYGGMNFYLGNRPSGDGAARARPGGEWDALEGAASRTGSSRNEQDRYYLARTFDEISAQPGSYLKLAGSKLIWSLQNEELRDTHSYFFFADALPWTQFLPAFGVVLALAAIGLTAPSTGRLWLIAFFAAMLLSVIFLVVGTRYRIPLLPPMFVLAGVGVATLATQIRARSWKRVGMLAAIGVAVWASSQLRRDMASRNFAEELALTGLALLQERRLEESETAFRSAIHLDDSSLAWDGLGLVLQRRELRNSARGAFERAVRINPMNATAWLHLGLSYEFLGNSRAAITAYQQALEITPQRAQAIDMLEAARRRYK